jgi:hypothetical protein
MSNGAQNKTGGIEMILLITNQWGLNFDKKRGDKKSAASFL